MYSYFSHEIQQNYTVFVGKSQEFRFSLLEIGKFLFYLNIFKSRLWISFKTLSSNYLCPSASIQLVFLKNYSKKSTISQGTRLCESIWRFFPLFLGQINVMILFLTRNTAEIQYFHWNILRTTIFTPGDRKISIISKYYQI